MAFSGLKSLYKNHILSAELMDRFFSGMFWSFLGLVFSKGGVLLAFIFVARLLEKEEFGELGVVQTTALMLGSFVGYGLGLSATKNIAEFKNTNKAKSGGVLFLTLVATIIFAFLLSVVVYFYAELIAVEYLNNSGLLSSLRIASVLVFFSAINSALYCVASGFEAFKKIASVNLLVGIVSVPSIFAGVYYGGVDGVLVSLCMNALVSVMLCSLLIRNELKSYDIFLNISDFFENSKSLINFSLPATLAGLLVGPVNWTVAALLVNTENGYSEMAMFNAANQWFNVLVFLPGVIGSVILPILSERFGAGKKSESDKALFFSVKVNLLLVVPLVLSASLFSKHIMGFYGASYEEGEYVLIFTLLAASFMVANSPVGQYLAASGKMWIGFFMNSFWGAAFLISSFFLLDYGALGIAVARCLAYFLHLLWQFLYVYIILIKETS